MMIFSSGKAASCRCILSNPTSSTVFPLILIESSLESSAVAYLDLMASMKPSGVFAGLFGRMNDAAVEDGDLPLGQRNGSTTCSRTEIDTVTVDFILLREEENNLHWKYLNPS